MDQNKPTITIIASLATDVLIDETGIELRRQQGGPARYLSQAIKQENIAFSLISPPEVTIDILITKQGEFGRVKEHPLPMTVDFAGIESEALIISTLLDEISLTTLPDYNGLVIMDVQGYVREGSDFGKKKIWSIEPAIAEAIDCLKATAEEIEFLPQRFVEKMKQKILIITKGAEGCEIFNQGASKQYYPEKIVSTDNTIGAGDTFLGYFTTEYLRSWNIDQAARYSTTQTIKFLESKTARAVA